MNVKLHLSLDFIAGIWFEGMLQFNNYNVNFQFVTASTNQVTIGTAIDRVKYFVEQELNHTVFLHEQYPEIALMLQEIGADVTTLPEEPVDQIIGIMLYCKLNTIMEQQVFLTSLDISSVLGQSVWYSHSDDDALGPFANHGWWCENNVSHNNLTASDCENNVVKVNTNSWRDYGLAWPQEQQKQPATVVYPDFRRNETK